jgi:hypothetical protein
MGTAARYVKGDVGWTAGVDGPCVAPATVVAVGTGGGLRMLVQLEDGQLWWIDTKCFAVDQLPRTQQHREQ